MAAVSSIVLPQIMLMAISWDDLKVLTEVGGLLTTMAQYEFKLLYLAIRREKAYKLYKELRSLWDSTDDLKERQSYEEFAYWGRKFTLIFYSFGAWTVTIYTITAVIECVKIRLANNDNTTRTLPFEVWYGTDVTETPYFEIAFACQLLAAQINCAGIWGIETSCMTMILHVCGQFRLINKWIRNIGTEINSNPIDDYCNCPKNVEVNLIKCIRHHQRMINAVNDVNNLLTPIIFMQLLTSGIKICLSGFAVINNNTSAELVKAVIYLIGMTTQLLLWCCPGEILIQESQQVGEIAYLNVPWYKLPPIYRRQLLLIILRSQKHCSITAITFQRLSFRTLTSVFNTAASYFTLLRQMQETRMSV
ncbi:odorant receptor 22c-like [Osmia lignaria lignaria]|uniref:odorant receptor 22c-like n=1 Tax=Osmia lignaria lignaria TaxID=1437193 RepID=UPI00402BC1AA